MARPARRLGVWMNGERVGSWAVQRGEHVFDYAGSWLRSPRFRVLSLSLPATGGPLKGERVAHFFDNLLPDNPLIRQRIQARHRLRGNDAFTLLQAIGRDCVGAVQLLPEDQAPEGWNRLQARPLQEADVAALLHGMLSPVPEQALDEDDWRISLAGAQEKTALLHMDGRWWLPQAATPTTHILKLPLGQVGGSGIALRHSVENEWLCMQLLAGMGLPVARTFMARFGAQRVLVVERFDRAWVPPGGQGAGRHVLRLPQEDMCQAFGMAPVWKYQADGGPAPERILDLLGQSHQDADRGVFALSLLAFWLLAAPDGHAKNFSIFLGRGSRISLTPLYDVLSMHPYLGRQAGQIHPRKLKLAMRLPAPAGGDYAMHSMQARHWQRLALSVGGPALWQRMRALVEGVDALLERQQPRLPADFPEPVWTAIAHGLRGQARRFLAALP